MIKRDESLDNYDYAYLLQEEAEEWAKFDGCEGGDYLGALAGALSMWHYSMIDQKEVFTKLKDLTLAEINAQIEWQNGEGRQYNDEGAFDQVAERVQKIWTP